MQQTLIRTVTEGLASDLRDKLGIYAVVLPVLDGSCDIENTQNYVIKLCVCDIHLAQDTVELSISTPRHHNTFDIQELSNVQVNLLLSTIADRVVYNIADPNALDAISDRVRELLASYLVTHADAVVPYGKDELETRLLRVD